MLPSSKVRQCDFSRKWIEKVKRFQYLAHFFYFGIVVDSLNSILQRYFGYLCGFTGDPLHSRALAHSRAPLFTQPCPHCSHSRAPGEQWARLCVFTLQGCVQAARLCKGSPVGLWITFSTNRFSSKVSPVCVCRQFLHYALLQGLIFPLKRRIPCG